MWAGLYAWQTIAPRFAGETAPIALPAQVAVTLDTFPPPSPRVVDASIELRSGALPSEGTLAIHLTGARAVDGPDRLAILDGRTDVALADVALPDLLPTTLRLAGIPPGSHRVVGYRNGESPRCRYAFRRDVEFEVGTVPAEATVEIDVTTTSPVVLVELLAPPSEAIWLPVTAQLRRVDDPAWSAPPTPDQPRTFEAGNSDLVFEFAPLGVGRYELTFVGFESAEPVVFDLPSDELITVSGLPAR